MSLKWERNRLHITQKQLADAAGVPVRWIQKIENGEIKLENITFLNAFKLLKGLEAFETDEVLSGIYRDFHSGYFVIRDLLKLEEESHQQD